MNKRLSYYGRLCSGALLIVGVTMSGGLLADKKDGVQRAEESANRLQSVDKAFGSRADEARRIRDKVLNAPGNIFRSPTYIVHEGDRKVIFAGEGNEVNTLFNKSLKDSKGKQ